MSSPFQSRFLTTHERIKLDNADENATLRQKRDAVLHRMRDRGLAFESFNQGSYAMCTGIVPLDGDFDIDVGVVLSGTPQPSDPLVAKMMVYKAVLGHTPKVEWRRHCIRVQYMRAGKPTVHVDLPVYWRTDRFWGTTLHLAIGKQHSGAVHRSWEESEPNDFIDKVKNFREGEERLQFRRVVRYLKRWKDLHFPTNGNGAPVGIGITIAALTHFRPSFVGMFLPASASGFDDLAATKAVVDGMRLGVSRIRAPLPTKPHRDVFGRMTDQQMREFRARLDLLSSQLDDARQRNDIAPLREAFGADF